jgi:hypothetical protein
LAFETIFLDHSHHFNNNMEWQFLLVSHTRWSSAGKDGE